MKLEIQPGKYVVAVSGGVDSMVLLNMLVHMPDLELVVAHFDHGIRSDSKADAELVAMAAARYGLPFELGHGRLGEDASENEARQARYAFLHAVRTHYDARAIITAHHQSDVLETMIINMARGTNRKGLASLRSQDVVLRPLLDTSKEALLTYARAHAITWHEDSTNSDVRYLRNYIRQVVMPRMNEPARERLLDINKQALRQNHVIDELVHEIVSTLGGPEKLERHGFIMLPHSIAREVMAAWLRSHQVRDLSRQQIERLVVAAKTGRPHATYDVDRLKIMNISRKFLQITSRDSRNTTI